MVSGVGPGKGGDFMSPEIYIGKKLIASTPDTTGLHQMLDGRSLYVDVSGIDADAEVQKILLEAEEIGGRRELQLTHEGILESSNSRRGDGKRPEISVKLLPEDRPIRVSSKRKVWKDRPKTLAGPNDGGYYVKIHVVRYQNPRWIRGNGRR